MDIFLDTHDLGAPTSRTQSYEPPRFQSYGQPSNYFSFLLDREDWFEFTLTAGALYEFRSSSVIASRVKTISASLYSATGPQMAEVASSTAEAPDDEFCIRFSPDEDGTYLLKVESRGVSRYELQYAKRPWPRTRNEAEARRMIYPVQPERDPNRIPRPEPNTLQAQPAQPAESANPPGAISSGGAGGRNSTPERRAPKRERTNANDSGPESLPLAGPHAVPPFVNPPITGEESGREPVTGDTAELESAARGELYSAHPAFEVEKYADLEYPPAEGYTKILFGTQDDFIMTAKAAADSNIRALVWHVDGKSREIARTSPGVKLLGLSYGTRNSIMALIENAHGVHKLYKISGLFKSIGEIRFGKPDGENANGEDRSNGENGTDRRSATAEEGRRRTGDRRSGVDRRQNPHPGRRSGDDRRRVRLTGRRENGPGSNTNAIA